MNPTFSDLSGMNNRLYPFTQTRNLEDIRIGILTIREKWEKINASGEIDATLLPGITNPSETKKITRLTDLIHLNDWAIRQDFALLTKDKQSQKISSSNWVIAPENIFIEEGAIVNRVFINASGGSVYIGKDAEVMEGSMLRGPVTVCKKAVVKMGAKIYGATTIGPYCTVGGEIKNSILFGFSNKAHDGYLGDSVIGEWCNLGAGTTNSNLKNTAGNINLWNNASQTFEPAGNKCGVFIGDYSRTAINTSLNSGTVVGVCCNIFGDVFSSKLIPNFSWGKEKYQWEKLVRDIDNWKKLKGRGITGKEQENLFQLYKNQLT